MSDIESTPLPRLAYFIHLHLDTVCRKRCHERIESLSVYEVEGKPRPMMIIRTIPKKKSRAWYWTLPITSKHREHNKDLLLIGNCLRDDTVSYVDLKQIHALPDTMLHRVDGKSPFLEPCNRLGFESAFRIVAYKVLAKKLPRGPIVG